MGPVAPNMLSRVVCLSVFLSVTAALAEQAWPAYKTTFMQFNDQPRTVTEAEELGWVLVGSCDGVFAGHRYSAPDDYSLVLIFDDAGYIAGEQSVVPLEEIDAAYVDISNNPAYILGEWFGLPVFYTTAYFVDPAIICNGGRDEATFEVQGTGDRLLLQNGLTPETYITIPMTETEAIAEGYWFKHLCIPAMGYHYTTFDYNPSQDCNSVMPFHILYDLDVMVGFVWQHEGNFKGANWEHPDQFGIAATIADPPTCVATLMENVGITTLHHYFVSNPLLASCP